MHVPMYPNPARAVLGHERRTFVPHQRRRAESEGGANALASKCLWVTRARAAALSRRVMQANDGTERQEKYDGRYGMSCSS